MHVLQNTKDFINSYLSRPVAINLKFEFVKNVAIKWNFKQLLVFRGFDNELILWFLIKSILFIQDGGRHWWGVYNYFYPGWLHPQDFKIQPIFPTTCHPGTHYTCTAGLAGAM